MAGRITRHRSTVSTGTGASGSLIEPQFVSAELCERHFLAFHNSMSRLDRIKFQLAVNGSLLDDDDYTSADNSSNNNDGEETTEDLITQHQKFGVVCRKRKPNQYTTNNNDNNNADPTNQSNTNSINNSNGNFLPPILTGTENCEIRMITDPSHPAFRQCGLFATKKINANTVIMPYAGLLTLVGTVPSSQTYVMSYNGEDSDLGIDAEYFGNYARFANDPRGTGLASNAHAMMKWTRLGEMYTGLISRRLILEGEEILLDYGKKHKLSKVPLISRKGKLLTHERPVIPFQNLSWNNNKKTIEHENQNDSDDHDEQANSNKNTTTRMRCVWQCLQCDAWNDGGDLLQAPWTLAVTCTSCHQPRASETTPVLAIMNKIMEEQHKELKSEKTSEDRRRKRNTNNDDDDDDGKEEEQQRQQSAIPSRGVFSPTFTIERPSVGDDLRGNPRPVQGATMEESSIPASWPLQFPFVSWQVWDPEISIFALNGNASKFVSQSAISVARLDGDDEAEGSRNEERIHPAVASNNEIDDDDDHYSPSLLHFDGSQGVFCKSFGRANDEIGVAGGILVHKRWSDGGKNAKLKYFGYPTPALNDHVHLENEKGGNKISNSNDGHEGDHQKKKQENVNEKQTREVTSTKRGEGTTSTIDQGTRFLSSFVTPYLVLNLRYFKVSHRPLVQIPQGELDRVPMIKIPHPPRQEVISPDLLDYFFYPTNEAQYLRVATPKKRRERISSRSSSSHHETMQSDEKWTRNYLPEDAFDSVPESSFANEFPNSTLELIRDPIGFIYIAIVAVDEVSEWSEVVI